MFNPRHIFTTFALLLAVASLMLTSCSKDEEEQSNHIAIDNVETIDATHVKVDGVKYQYSQGSYSVVGYDTAEIKPNVSIYTAIRRGEKDVAVRTISNYAFNKCTTLRRVSIPDSVTTIDTAAFMHNEILTEVTLPSHLTSIGTSAFAMASHLKKITIPATVTSIGTYAFSDCCRLQSAVIPDQVTKLLESTFTRCLNIKMITLPKGITSFGSECFNRCENLERIIFKGTKAQWKAITKGRSWNRLCPSTAVIQCADGEIPMGEEGVSKVLAHLF